ncbi:hypothetical protein FCR2A7T_00980 [Flavobacterium cauense R2A-7]|uniref:Uncharacterized protein n=1 Tax=Flavobacterium cauense R2A-7 TaxID=1341154 RepID=V6S5G4_9FLAO|nr:hypothetical protein [Flavobacterium cauense]ESU21644.1 hypothetical protein FCR2A7T_00980 [Flavobacterium cauense R2A-7]KGO80110.1 hypothetical protein Q762_12380 [Flavobacterium cauense R2A-7]TWI10418.1 hypothetical protein IP98_02228 [Flavobacterium cauense R2A-7]
MNKKDLFIGVLIGLLTASLGCILFLYLFTEARSLSDLQMVRAQGLMGKLITLGAIFNLIAFFILLKFEKELMAKGIILATIILAILTVIL